MTTRSNDSRSSGGLCTSPWRSSRPRRIEAFEVGAGDREHRVTGVEPDDTVGAVGEQLEHATRSGPDVEHPSERPIADRLDDHRFDRPCRGVQRTFFVPDRCDLFEVLPRRCRTPLPHDVEAAEVTDDHRVVVVDGIEGGNRHGELRSGVDETEERPRSFADVW